MNIQVEKEDINKIGYTGYKEDGFLAIICNGDTSNIEEILLRSILKCFGEEYHIVSSEDYIWQDNDGEEVYDIQFTTNLPYDIYMECNYKQIELCRKQN